MPPDSPARRSPLTDRTAVVTGGSRGLGLLLAARLAVRRCRVTVLARDAEELERAAAWIRERTGVRVATAVCDVRDRPALAEVLRNARDEHGGLDAVFANAGVIQVAPAATLGVEQFDDAMATVFGGTLHTALEALPHLRRSTAGGRLVVTGSVGGLLAVPHLLPYSCAKAAVAALAEGLQAETAGSSVSVTAAHPGLMRTGSHRQAEFGGHREQEYSWFSALAGAPLVSMDAERAAERIVRAAELRRTRVVLTPAARAASLAHGLAPTVTTRLSGVAARLLPDAPPAAGTPPLTQGHDLTPRTPGPWAERARRWGAALGERAAARYNQQRPGPPTSSRG